MSTTSIITLSDFLFADFNFSTKHTILILYFIFVMGKSVKSESNSCGWRQRSSSHLPYMYAVLHAVYNAVLILKLIFYHLVVVVMPPDLINSYYSRNIDPATYTVTDFHRGVMFLVKRLRNTTLFPDNPLIASPSPEPSHHFISSLLRFPWPFFWAKQFPLVTRGAIGIDIYRSTP